jgi:cyclopropane fatty-acyl-phospholipid synthase-like methyltransferase
MALTATAKARQAWQRLYSKRGLQYGGTGDLSLIKPHIQKGMTVLDAGCGDGKTAEALARICDVVACDFSREALNTLRGQRDPERVVELVECNLHHIPFAPEKYDAVTCVHTLSHMLENERVMAASELSGTLALGGFMYVEVFGRGDMRYGTGEEAEPATFLRGDGIMTHYFEEGEVGSLFSDLEVVSEIGAVRRVVFGAAAGKREVRKVLLRKR